MQLRLNNLTSNDYFLYFIILTLTFLRVVTSKLIPCGYEMDCESYLAMLQSIQYHADIPGHHAMRILPSLLAKIIHHLGFSPAHSFQIISGTSYCLLGMGLFWIFRKVKLHPWQAFAFTLLCLAPHHAMRISLQLVYQACDMMTYLFTLGIVYYSLKKHQNENYIFILSLLGCLTRQNLFVLGELSLLFCLFTSFKLKTLLYMLLIGIGYSSLQIYYHASSVFSELLHPPPGYFSLSHLYHIFMESGFLALIVPIVPFIIISFGKLFKFFKENWHLFLYMSITIGQPVLGYHLTGGNFQRLALQGVWILFLACALIDHQRLKANLFFMVTYALAVYFTWGMSQRILFSSLLLGYFFISSYFQKNYFQHRPLRFNINS